MKMTQINTFLKKIIKFYDVEVWRGEVEGRNSTFDFVYIEGALALLVLY